MTNTANDRPQEWYDARADHLAEFLTDERRRTLATALAERTSSHSFVSLVPLR